LLSFGDGDWKRMASLRRLDPGRPRFKQNSASCVLHQTCTRLHRRDSYPLNVTDLFRCLIAPLAALAPRGSRFGSRLVRCHSGTKSMSPRSSSPRRRAIRSTRSATSVNCARNLFELVDKALRRTRVLLATRITKLRRGVTSARVTAIMTSWPCTHTQSPAR
jgi:hypothetical protein